ncbi:MAG: M56 family metallopeptidase, partial [Muribaculaceae bacterium]|nr:M56 family metallopeptidase [Muribaculaceae bacterium]
MGTWISYTLTSGIILLCLHLAYSWAMAGDNQPRFNRAILLGCYILAAILPLTDFSLSTGTATETATAEIAQPMIAGVLTANEESASSLWPWILAGLYLAGAFAVTTMTVIALLRLHRIVSKAEKIPYRRYTIAIVDDRSIAPFSWRRYIVMNRDDYTLYRDLILTHETAHLERYHRLDLMAARFFEIIMWYNPAAWLMTSSLRAVHEFEADRAVIGNIDNPGDYQMLLIKKAVGRSFPVLANSLNHSNLKKRITMMLNPTSRKSRRMRALALAPAAAIALLSINLPFMARAIDSVAAIDLSADSKDTEKAPITQIAIVNTSGSEDTTNGNATANAT